MNFFSFLPCIVPTWSFSVVDVCQYHERKLKLATTNTDIKYEYRKYEDLNAKNKNTRTADITNVTGGSQRRAGWPEEISAAMGEGCDSQLIRT